MKNSLLYLLVAVSLLLNFVLLFLFTSANNENEIGTKSENTSEHHEIELAIYMGRMQLFMNKLYFSGIGNNNDLVHFYIHELEEAMEEIEHANVIDDGVNISTNIKLFGLDQIENLEKSLEAGDDFITAYNTLVTSCNNCHNASKYPFIIIKEPTNPVFDNQVYEKPTY